MTFPDPSWSGTFVVDVQLLRSEHTPGEPPGTSRHATRTPHDLFAEYLVRQGMNDDRIVRLFGELLDQESV